MKLFSKLWDFLINNLDRILVGLLVFLVIISIGVMGSDYVKNCVSGLIGLTAKNKILTFLGIGMGGILFILQVLASHRRAKAMEAAANEQANSAKAQARATEEQARANENTEQGQRQERLKNAIEHLGQGKDTVRLGGAYELFHLAEDNKDLRKTAFDMLCLHIRQTTGEKGYQENYKSKPSEEIQSLLTLLFVQDHEVFKGLQINLQGIWLNGADLRKARLQGAILAGTHLQRATLSEARLQEANLVQARLQGADLREAQLQKVDLSKARLQGAILQGAKLQCAKLIESYLQGAFLYLARLQKADFHWAYLQGAYLENAHLQGANLFGARLQGAILQGAKLQCADMRGAWLQGALLVLAQLQEADLAGALLHGVVSGDQGPEGIPIAPAASIPKDQIWRSLRTPSSFAERMTESIDQKHDLSGVTFAGGLSQEKVDSFVEGLSNKKANELRERLESHIDQPASNELPENLENGDDDNMTYPKEDAETWIAEYEEAMSEVPEDDS